MKFVLITSTPTAADANQIIQEKHVKQRLITVLVIHAKTMGHVWMA